MSKLIIWTNNCPVAWGCRIFSTIYAGNEVKPIPTIFDWAATSHGPEMFIIISFGYSRVISHLNISSIHSSDGGLYRCRASNTVRIHNFFIPDFVFNIQIHDFALSSGWFSATLSPTKCVWAALRSRCQNITAVSSRDVLLICPVSGFPLERCPNLTVFHLSALP